jgi:hypothetical protein
MIIKKQTNEWVPVAVFEIFYAGWTPTLEFHLAKLITAEAVTDFNYVKSAGLSNKCYASPYWTNTLKKLFTNVQSINKTHVVFTNNKQEKFVLFDCFSFINSFKLRHVCAIFYFWGICSYIPSAFPFKRFTSSFKRCGATVIQFSRQ